MPLQYRILFFRKDVCPLLKTFWRRTQLFNYNYFQLRCYSFCYYIALEEICSEYRRPLQIWQSVDNIIIVLQGSGNAFQVASQHNDLEPSASATGVIFQVVNKPTGLSRYEASISACTQFLLEDSSAVCLVQMSPRVEIEYRLRERMMLHRSSYRRDLLPSSITLPR